jgi:hypothetical protein
VGSSRETPLIDCSGVESREIGNVCARGVATSGKLFVPVESPECVWQFLARCGYYSGSRRVDEWRSRFRPA